MTMDDRNLAGLASRVTSRRRLLQASSAGAVSLVLVGAGGHSSEAVASTLPAYQPITFGFNDPGSDNASLVDAARLPSGEPWTSESISVRVAALWPADGAGSLEHVERMTIDLVNPFVPEAPVMAWWYSARPVPQSSSPVTHRIPADGSGLTIQLSYTLTGEEASTEVSVSLSSGSEDGVPKLRRGIYCFALPGTAHHDWDHLRLLDVEDGDGRVYRCLCEPSSAGDVLSSCPYLLVTIS